jgi:hypothetical protein
MAPQPTAVKLQIPSLYTLSATARKCNLVMKRTVKNADVVNVPDAINVKILLNLCLVIERRRSKINLQSCPFPSKYVFIIKS